MARRKATDYAAQFARPDAGPPEPVVDPDAALLQGSPENGSPMEPAPSQPSGDLPPPPPAEAAPAPEHVTVRIGDLDVKVPADQADALRRSWEAAQTRTQTYETLLQQRVAPAAAPTPEPARPATDYTTQLFTNPNEVLAQIRREAVAEATAAFAPVQQQLAEFKQQQAVKGFFDAFYEANKDLRGSEFLVESLASKNLDRLKTMSTEGARDELARLTRDYEIGVMKRRAITTPAAPSRTVIEGASPVSARAAAAPEVAGPASLSQTIKDRRAARRTASQRLN